MGVTFPNESPEYRAARNTLLQREVALRREMETVAAEVNWRLNLPLDEKSTRRCDIVSRKMHRTYNAATALS